MRIDLVKVAEEEAQRFLERVADLRAVVTRDSNNSSSFHPAQSGAVRRASLDLTRALAAMRNAK